MGSAGFLLIFAAVNAANARLREETGSSLWMSLLGVFACVAALGAVVWQAMRTQPAQLWVLAAMLGAAFAIEAGYRLFGRTMRLRGN
jgi:hypothetical protein